MKAIYWFLSELTPRNAGYRVRTLPIVEELRTQGMTVEVLPLSDLPLKIDMVAQEALAVIVSKPPDSSAILAVRHLTALKIPVIVDLFDNYFAWSGAAYQKQLQWQWLRAIDAASMIICSTDYLKHVVQSLTSKPALRVGDAVRTVSAGQRSAAGFEAKWVAPSRIEFLWFGISANPYYHAGLEDLRGWISGIRTMMRTLATQLEIRLTVCTNRVPAVDLLMTELRQHEIDARYIEWSAEGCEALLASSHVTLLPTNASGFSLAKTHNRCSDSLAHGALVLASPHGPYSSLSGAVFTDPQLLVSVLMHANVDGVRQLLDESFAQLRAHNDTPSEVARLRTAILQWKPQDRRIQGNSKAAPPLLVAGRSKAEHIKFSRSRGYLVVGFAGSSLKLNYDFRMEPLASTAGVLTLTLSARGAQALETALLSDVDFDVRGEDSLLDCQGGGFHVCFDRKSSVLRVLSGIDSKILTRLAALQEQHGAGDATAAVWYDAHVDVATRLLYRLGFHSMEFAADEEGGWREFAANANSGLMKAHRRLEDLWVKSHGNELDWPTSQGLAS
ncbi:MAG: hypothetical protein ACJ8IK_09695 [Burkholderiaceae bacterium]